MKSGVIIGIVIVLALLVGGFFLFQSDKKEVIEQETTETENQVIVEEVEEETPPLEQNTNQQIPIIPTTHNVEIINFKLPSITIKVGDTITWTNKDSAAHTATSLDNPKVFDSDRLDTGDTFSFTFTKTGSFNYFCEIHPSMKGAITIE